MFMAISDCVRCMLRIMIVIIGPNMDDEAYHDDATGSKSRSEFGLTVLRSNNHDTATSYNSAVDGLTIHKFVTSSSTIQDGGESHLFQLTRTATVQIVHQRQLHRDVPVAYYLRGLQDNSNDIDAGTTGNATSTIRNGHMNDAAYLSDDEVVGNPFTAGTIISLILCGIIVILFVWLCYCAYWFSYGGSAGDYNDDEINEITLSKEERMDYMKQVLICKKYVSPQSSLPISDSTIVPNNPDDAECIHTDVGQNISSTCDGRNNIQQSPERLHLSPQCAICLEHFVDGDSILDSSSINEGCTHQFHQSCIYQWCMLKSNCPCCRRDLLFIRDMDDATEHGDSFRTSSTR